MCFAPQRCALFLTFGRPKIVPNMWCFFLPFDSERFFAPERRRRWSSEVCSQSALVPRVDILCFFVKSDKELVKTWFDVIRCSFMLLAFRRMGTFLKKPKNPDVLGFSRNQTVVLMNPVKTHPNTNFNYTSIDSKQQQHIFLRRWSAIPRIVAPSPYRWHLHTWASDLRA